MRHVELRAPAPRSRSSSGTSRRSIQARNPGNWFYCYANPGDSRYSNPASSQGLVRYLINNVSHPLDSSTPGLRIYISWIRAYRYQTYRTRSASLSVTRRSSSMGVIVALPTPFRLLSEYQERCHPLPHSIHPNHHHSQEQHHRSKIHDHRHVRLRKRQSCGMNTKSVLWTTQGGERLRAPALPPLRRNPGDFRARPS